MKSFDKWVGYQFKSATGPTEEYKSFTRAFKAFLKRNMKNTNLELVDFSRGHFYISVIVKNKVTNALVSIILSDVRDWNWFNNICYRTIRDKRDTTGARNNYTTIGALIEDVEKLSARTKAV